MRIGIDVGGTNTDAVLLDDVRVLAAVKRPTTRDTAAGVAAVLVEVLRAARRRASDVDAVMVGTTTFTNAFIEAERLTPTGVIRLGLPATASIPPLADWPPRLRAAIGGPVFLCHGGCDYDGSAIAPLDEDEIARAAWTLGGIGVQSMAISSVFSPVNAEFEIRAAAIVTHCLPGADVSLSHEFGSLGLLERENATVVNAAIRGLAARFVDALSAAVLACGVTVPVLISQNDGTLMNLDAARRRPVAMVESGPTNSMRGAGWLSGLDDCVVVDVGGTTSDVGVLVHGFPRERTGVGYLGGVRTNVRMPDITSLGIGGGSRVRGVRRTRPLPRRLSRATPRLVRVAREVGPAARRRLRIVWAWTGRPLVALPPDPGAVADAGIEPPGIEPLGSEASAIGHTRAGAALPAAYDPAADDPGVGRSAADIPDREASAAHGVELGPDSVAGRIRRAALVFGGTTMTATDLAVAAGRARLGDPDLVRGLDRRAVRHTLVRVAHRIARVADDMRTSPEPLPLVVVGGAGFLIPTSLPGFAEVHRPALYSVANAIGAAIAQVGADVDRVFQVEPGQREEVLAKAKNEATARALAAGARAGTVRVVDVEEIPLSYIAGGAVRVRVKAVGDLDVRRLGGPRAPNDLSALGEPTH